jgi:hypothetical protein
MHLGPSQSNLPVPDGGRHAGGLGWVSGFAAAPQTVSCFGHEPACTAPCGLASAEVRIVRATCNCKLNGFQECLSVALATRYQNVRSSALLILLGDTIHGEVRMRAESRSHKVGWPASALAVAILLFAPSAPAAAQCTGQTASPTTAVRVTSAKSRLSVGDLVTFGVAPVDTSVTIDSLLPSWKSSDNSVLTIENDGTARALGVGDARVTVCLAGSDGEVRGTSSAVVTVSNGVFSLDASLGAAIKLNGDTGKAVSQLAGLTGEVVLMNWRLGSRGDVLPLAGRVTLSGNLYITLAAAAVPESTTTTDAGGMNSTVVDTTLRFDDGSYGWLRLGIPLLTFRRVITLYAVGEDGYVAFRSKPDLWHQQYAGLQIQMGSSESYVESLWGKSENLRPATTRWRMTVQLQLPDTPLTFRLVEDRAPGDVRGNTDVADSPIGVAVFTKIPLKNFFRALGVLPQ